MTAPLVSVPWLRDHLDGVTLLDASIERSPGRFAPGMEAFAEAHIPGARLADLFGGFSDPDAALLFTLPSVDGLREAARAVGVHDGARVVVYDRNGGAWAARVWWLLRIHGFDQVSVLDGGLGGWDGPLESGLPAPVPGGELTLHSPGEVTADIAEVARVSRGDEEGLLVCGLRRTEFEGPAGRIPGSVNLPYAELARPDGTLDLDRVRREAGVVGLDHEGGIVYCGGGINAAGLVLALTAAGLPAPRLYDGSLNEWRADPSLPLATGPA